MLGGLTTSTRPIELTLGAHYKYPINKKYPICFINIITMQNDYVYLKNENKFNIPKSRKNEYPKNTMREPCISRVSQKSMVNQAIRSHCKYAINKEYSMCYINIVTMQNDNICFVTTRIN